MSTISRKGVLLGAAAAGVGLAIPAAQATPSSDVLDPRDFGAMFNGTTDDTAAIQAALDAAPLASYMGLSNPNDWPCRVVQMPAGRAKISSPLLLPANVWLRGSGSSSTYLVNAGTGNTIQLKTGKEVQVSLTDFGVIVNARTAKGIELQQVGSASILGDSAHCIDNVVVVGGTRALFTFGCTEIRISNFLAYRQTPALGDAAVYLGGTDLMVERLTVAQPQYFGTGQQGAGLRCGTSNSRLVNVKVFGGNSTFNGAMQSAFWLIGQRNQVIGLEVQDYHGAWAIEDPQGNNMYQGVVVDSCQGGGAVIGGPVVMNGALFVNRGGGAYVMQQALSIPDGRGAQVDCRVVNVPKVLASPSQTGAGNFVRVNGVPL